MKNFLLGGICALIWTISAGVITGLPFATAYNTIADASIIPKFSYYALVIKFKK